MNGLNLNISDLDVTQRAQKQAKKLGLSVITYVSRLIIRDTQPERKKIKIMTVEEDYGGPIPKKLRELWDKEANEAEEEVRQGKRKVYTRVDELMADLDE